MTTDPPNLDRGLEARFEVKKLNDPTGKHDDCEYFVLDPLHDRAARTAMLSYAHEVRVESPRLAADLRALVAEALRVENARAMAPRPAPNSNVVEAMAGEIVEETAARAIAKAKAEDGQWSMVHNDTKVPVFADDKPGMVFQRWAAARAAARSLPPCAAVHPVWRGRDSCTLPKGHRGHHESGTDSWGQRKVPHDLRSWLAANAHGVVPVLFRPVAETVVVVGDEACMVTPTGHVERRAMPGCPVRPRLVPVGEPPECSLRAGHESYHYDRTGYAWVDSTARLVNTSAMGTRWCSAELAKNARGPYGPDRDLSCLFGAGHPGPHRDGTISWSDETEAQRVTRVARETRMAQEAAIADQKTEVEANANTIAARAAKVAQLIADGQIIMGPDAEPVAMTTSESWGAVVERDSAAVHAMRLLLAGSKTLRLVLEDAVEAYDLDDVAGGEAAVLELVAAAADDDRPRLKGPRA